MMRDCVANQRLRSFSREVYQEERLGQGFKGNYLLWSHRGQRPKVQPEESREAVQVGNDKGYFQG